MTIWESEEQAQLIFNKLMESGVLVRPLAGKLAHCIRISVGRPDELEWLIENLETLMEVVPTEE
jgi:histidinol-phosphate aminotransferase